MDEREIAAVKSVLEASPQAAQWTMKQLVQPVWPHTGIWVAHENNEVVGMVAARAAGGEAEILNLADTPAWRRHGLGRWLLETAIVAVREAGARRVFLEVRESNREARMFYAGLQFAEAGRRRNYYTDPGEDALVLSRTLE